MLERLRRNLTESKYGPLGLEMVVVVLGILMAFQIDRWAEERHDRTQEYNYLLRLKEDLQIEIRGMDKAIQYAEDRVAAVLLLEKVIANPSIVKEQHGTLPVALETATWRSFPQISAFVYTELQSSGNLALIQSEPLRRELANYYSTIQHYSRVGLDLEIQHHFDRLTAGLLSTAELLSIEEGSWSGSRDDISMDRAAQIVEELTKSQDAIDLLPNIAQHHVFNQKVIKLARAQALSIIETIDLLAEDFQD
jgi:hypothetical protein